MIKKASFDEANRLSESKLKQEEQENNEKEEAEKIFERLLKTYRDHNIDEAY